MYVLRESNFRHQLVNKVVCGENPYPTNEMVKKKMANANDFDVRGSKYFQNICRTLLNYF